MVGQAAEGLGADDVVGAGVNQLQHLRGEQPALAHLAALAQIALDQLPELGEVAGGAEAGLFQRSDHVVLALFDVVHKEFADFLFGEAAAVDVHIHDPVVDFKDHKVRQAGHHRLCALRQQEILQVVVAQRGELHIDLAHHADADFLLVVDGNSFEVLDDLRENLLHGAAVQALAPLEALHQVTDPVVNQQIRVALALFIGADLVGHVHDEVAVHHAVDQLLHQGNGQREAGVALLAKADGNDRDIVHSRLFQRLTQQIDVVGGPAAAAGLGDEQGDFVGVIAAVLDGVHKLADDQQGGVAGVVVDVFQTLVHHVAAVVVQLVHLVALQQQQLAEQLKVDGQHLRHQNGVFVPHLLGEQQTAGLIVD